MFVSFMRMLYIVYTYNVVKKVISFLGARQLMGMAHKRMCLRYRLAGTM